MGSTGARRTSRSVCLAARSRRPAAALRLHAPRPSVDARLCDCGRPFPSCLLGRERRGARRPRARRRAPVHLRAIRPCAFRAGRVRCARAGSPPLALDCPSVRRAAMRAPGRSRQRRLLRRTPRVCRSVAPRADGSSCRSGAWRVSRSLAACCERDRRFSLSPVVAPPPLTPLDSAPAADREGALRAAAPDGGFARPTPVVGARGTTVPPFSRASQARPVVAPENGPERLSSCAAAADPASATALSSPSARTRTIRFAATPRPATVGVPSAGAGANTASTAVGGGGRLLARRIDPTGST